MTMNPTLETMSPGQLVDLGESNALFSCSAYEMRQALATVKPAVVKRHGALPVLSGVLVTAGDGRVRVTCSNLETTISVDVPADMAEAGAMVIPFPLLEGMVNKVTKPTAKKKSPTLTVARIDEREVELVVGTRRRVLNLLPLEEYPRISDGDLTGMVSVDTAAIADVLGAVSSDDARPILCTVYFDTERGNMVGTDSYRLYVTDGPAAEDWVGDAPESLLVPATSLGPVVKAGGRPVMSVSGRQQAVFEWADDEHGHLRVTTRLCEGEFPRYHGLIPAALPERMAFGSTAEVKAALEILRKSATEPNTPVRLGGADGEGVKLWVVEQDIGTDEVTVAGVASDPSLSVAFNPKYLLEAVATLEGEGCALELLDAQKPAVMREARSWGGERLRLLMPVRTS